MEGLLARASEIYAVDYFGVIIVVAILELIVPRRAAGDELKLRWTSNFGIAILGTLMMRTVFPAFGLLGAALSEQYGIGLLNYVVLPSGVSLVVTILALDLVAYGQHFVLHQVDWLWRIHRTHHSDTNFDFTTGVRFHPLEALYTGAIAFAAVTLLGAPPAFVFISTLLEATNGFLEHSNIRIPPAINRVLRLTLVTPETHRVHHSRAGGDSQTNFGAVFPWWDRLFGTYRDEPSAGHDMMEFGVDGFEERRHQMLHWMLAQPFLKETPTAAPSERPSPIQPPGSSVTVDKNNRVA
jgi:sterol desaturase/sphingolipid hydroxylase (fatty acid hydroxylase superfamily)